MFLVAKGDELHFTLTADGQTVLAVIPRELAATLADEFRSVATAPSQCFALDDEVMA